MNEDPELATLAQIRRALVVCYGLEQAQLCPLFILTFKPKLRDIKPETE